MPYVVGVDVGGTFTDAFCISDAGDIASSKSPSTPPDFSRGIISSLDGLATELKLPSTSELLRKTAYVVHGTTATINAVVTSDASKVALITTRGHRDSIYIMGATGRYAGLDDESIQDIAKTIKPKPIVPKDLVEEINERIDYNGKEIVQLDLKETASAVKRILEKGVDAIAVSLLWSFKNPGHESQVRSFIHELDPKMYVSISSELVPKIGEYSRTSTTIFNCMTGPILARYVEKLQDRLHELGFQGPLLIMQSNGGVISARVAPRYSVFTLGSVLVGGLMGSMFLGQLLGDENIISTDVGGTTFLVGLVRNGSPIFTSRTFFNQYTLATSSARVSTIGSGGGAIAWVDNDGTLRVGPRSAAAVPGPACYNLGGDEPTVTDADLVLGIINPEFFLGGRIQLDKFRAEKALEKIGKVLGLTSKQVAMGVFEIQNSQTADLVRKVTVDAGYDPRDFALYAFGGAGPMHCFAYAKDLGINRIVIPLNVTASAFSAFGLVTSNLLQVVESSDPAIFPIEAERFNENFASLEEKAQSRLLEQGLDFVSYSLRREVDMRYKLQSNELSLDVKNGRLEQGDVDRLLIDFGKRYEELYGTGAGFEGAKVELLNYRVFCSATLPFKPKIQPFSKSDDQNPSAAFVGTRPAHIDLEKGEEPTKIFDYRRLRAGHVIEGPAIVELATTTVVIPGSNYGSIDAYGNIELHEI